MSASFDSYKIFYYVGKYKNITHAASALFLSQSTVSRSIQSLESELGCKLFDRTQYGVNFTIEGEILYRHVSQACERIFEGEEKVLKMQQLAQGSLRIGVSDFVFSKFVLPVLEDFHHDFPSLQLDIVSMGFDPYSSVADALMAGKIDVAFAVGSLNENLSNSAVMVTPVTSYNDIVIASSKFSELRHGSHSFSELANYPFISLVGRFPDLTYLDRIFRDKGLNIVPKFKVDSLGMFVPVIKRCQCLAVVPAPLKDEFTQTDPIFEVKTDPPLPSHDVSILTSRAAPQSSAREAFIKQFRKHINSNVYNAAGN
jgi:DNA-binding transcriptional LysR family regulator